MLNKLDINWNVTDSVMEYISCHEWEGNKMLNLKFKEDTELAKRRHKEKKLMVVA